MQIWNDAALSARIEATKPGTIAITSADPLARRALIATLCLAGLEGELVSRAEDRVMTGSDVVLYDDGAAPASRLVRPERSALEGDARWLALVASGARARAALGGGFRGALGRDVSPEALAVAVAAVRQGLVVVDPRFSEAVLPGREETAGRVPRTEAAREGAGGGRDELRRSHWDPTDTTKSPRTSPSLVVGGRPWRRTAPMDATLSLTPREREVLELLAEGISNKEIAARLGVSPHTAKFHVTALLDKLGAETRTEAVVLAARSGLLDL